MIVDAALFAVGFLVLFIGARGLVQGSSSLALRFRISPLVIGLTIVAFGTSMPELVVSIKATISGRGAIAIGNVIGSNIANVALILGLAAFLAPMKIRIQVLRLDAPLMIGSSLLFVYFFRDRLITWTEGLSLFLLFLGYTGFNVLMAGKEPNREVIQLEDETLPGRMNHWSSELLFIAGGLVFLVIGANLLVKSAVSMAQTFGVSEAIIGLTIVAIGTSLPELATSVVAAMHRQSEIAVGNVIGSNIFNLLCILGLAAMFSPIEGAGISPLDLWTMLISSALLLPFFWTRFELNRWEGLVLIGIYITYIVLLVDQNVIGVSVPA